MSNLLRLLINPTRNFCSKQPLSTICRQPFVESVKNLTLKSITCRFYQTSPKPLSGLTRSNFCTKAYDINTNVTKDVILFKYENARFFKILNIFGICQFVFWTYLSHFAFTTLRDAPVEKDDSEDLKWYERINLGENKYRNGITAMSFLIGNQFCINCF